MSSIPSPGEEQRALVEDRHQRAREAFYDLQRPYRSQAACLADTLEVATQVKITVEMIEAVAAAGQIPYVYQAAQTIKAFCAAAGFEIVE